MGERLLDFTDKWLISLPYTLCNMSRYKLIRVLGIFLMFPWIIIALLPSSILLIVFGMWHVIEEI